MRILAIETSGRRGAVATLFGEADNARLIHQTVLADDERTARALAPTLRQLLAKTGWSPNFVQLVAVAIGPGSFTGLRIGVTTAKTLAYAVGAEIIGVDTLAVLAAQVPPTGGPLWAIMDAQRQELFAARFERHGAAGLREASDTLIVPQDDWLAGLHAGEFVTGPALPKLAARLPTGVVAVTEDPWHPTAAAVGDVAWRAYQNGQRDDVWKLVPNYYRPSAAEEKLR